MPGGSLKSSDWLYRQIVDSSDDAILSKDRRAIITTWNAGAERLYGYSAREAIGRPVGLIIPDHRRGEESEILATALRGERIDHYETERRAKNGRLIDVSLTVSALRDDTGKVIGATTIARNICDRRRMERRLRYLADTTTR